MKKAGESESERGNRMIQYGWFPFL